MAFSVSHESATPPSAGTMSDMTLWTLPTYTTASAVTTSPTQFRMEIGGVTWTFKGENFTYLGDVLLTGTVTGFEIEQNGVVYADVSGIGMDVATAFNLYLNSGNTESFKSDVFSGNDTIDGAYHAQGYDGNDVITNAVIAEGGAGNDTITMQATAGMSVDGGNGDDTLVLTGGVLPQNVAYGGEGSDLIKGEWTVNDDFRADRVSWERIADATITGDGTANRIDLATMINDAADGGAVIVYGGGDNDAVFGVNAGVMEIYGGAGNDSLHARNASGFMTGGNGNDRIVGGPQDNVIEDLVGNDKIRGYEGNDLITVGDGGDFVDANEGDDTIHSTGGSNTEFEGGAGKDTLSGDGNELFYGGQADDTISMLKGNDTAYGGIGDDIFIADGTLDALDTITGGDGDDVIQLAALSGPFTLTTALKSVEVLSTQGGTISVADGAVAKNAMLTVDGGAFAALNFDGSAETDGMFALYGTGLNDTLTGGARNDIFRAGAGNDTINGGGGNDAIYFTPPDVGAKPPEPLSTLTFADKVDGGAGTDTMYLAGIYSGLNRVVFNATTMTNVETLVLQTGNNGGVPFSYDIVLNDANVAAGAKLTVDTTELRSNGPAKVDGHLETDASLTFLSGAGADTFIGGAKRDTFDGGGAGDFFTGGASADRYIYEAASDSTGRNFDTIMDFNALEDDLQFSFAVEAIDNDIASGALSRDTFDTDMANVVTAARLAPNHAVLFMPSAGFYFEHLFLVVDGNGVAGYQAGQDYVVELVNPQNIDDLAGSFTVG